MSASTRMRVVVLGFLSSLRSINSSTAEKRLETSLIRVIAYSSNNRMLPRRNSEWEVSKGEATGTKMSFVKKWGVKLLFLKIRPAFRRAPFSDLEDTYTRKPSIPCFL